MIDLQKARELLKAAVDTQGREFVYNPGGGGGCFYRPLEDADFDYYEKVLGDDPRKKTGCLVGTALTLNGDGWHLTKTVRISSMVDAFDHLTDEAVMYFQRAQDAQDKGKTWGEAYDIAEEYAGSLAGVE